jgi:hypothetical protein
LEAQRQGGADANDLWWNLGPHDNTQPFFHEAERLIDEMQRHNNSHRAYLDGALSHPRIALEAQAEVWDIHESTYTSDEMRLMHPSYYDRFLSPEAAARDLRIAEAIDYVTSPEYLGEQAEQRFYNEQDPHSEWYRGDLYHGEPGPDVQAAWDAQEDAFDQEQLRIAAGEPREASPEAKQAREYDTWEMSGEGITTQDKEIAVFERALVTGARHRLATRATQQGHNHARNDRTYDQDQSLGY